MTQAHKKLLFHTQFNSISFLLDFAFEAETLLRILPPDPIPVVIEGSLPLEEEEEEELSSPTEGQISNIDTASLLEESNNFSS
jgi:hypothetical protein